MRAGRVGRPHGLDGSFLVADAVPAVFTVGAEVVVAGRAAKVLARKGTDDRLIVRLDVATGRDQLEPLRGADIEVPDDRRPPLDDDEYWAEDLVGCRVLDGERELGVVRELLGLPSCEALLLEGSDVVVPLVRDAIVKVDIEAKTIAVNGEFLGLAT